MSKLSVKKPFTILVMVIVILILGGVSTSKMQLDLLPEVSLPYLLVITTYPGASPEKVEAEVCEPLENALGTINGVKNVYSVCNENYGLVELEFQEDTDLDSAMVKVSSAINSIESILPEESGTPSIMELSTNMLATQYLAVGYDGMDMERLSQFVEDTVVPTIERQDGVASVSSLGLIEKTIQVELNEEKVGVLNDKILAKADDAFADAVEQLDKAKEQLEDSEETLNKNKQKLVDSRKDLEDGKQDLIDGQKELDDSKKELRDKEAELNNSKATLEESKETLEKTKNETYQKLAEASKALDQLATYQAQLVNQQADKTALETAIKEIKEKLPADPQAQIEGLKTQLAELNEKKSGLEQVQTMLSVGQGEFNEMEKQALGALGIPDSISREEALALVAGMIKQIQDGINQIQGGIDQINTALDTLEQYQNRLKTIELEIQVTQGIIAQYETQLKSLGVDYTDIEKAKLEAASKFGSAEAQLAAGEAQLTSAQATIDSAKKQLDDAQKQIDTGWDSLADGEDQLKDGWKSINDGEDQIKDGWSDYEDAVRSYEKQKAEALKSANADDLISLSTLSGLIYAQNFSMPAGYVDDKMDNSWLVKVGDSYENIEELEQIVLCNIDDIGDVRLCDVADITVIDNSDKTYARLNGNPAVILSVFKSSTSGTNAVSKICKKAIADMESEYDGLSILIMMDQGDFITMIIKSVLSSMIVGAILAIIVLALFLKDVKPTIVVAISIPLSVLTAIVIMYFTNISLNMMSLSGMALGIGMLVDNSIVVIENIYRLRNKGISAPRAAVQGTRQVAGAIISSTLTTVCVFLPMVYTTGMIRDLLLPMCLTIIFCLMASLFIAMTVVPAAGSTLLKNTKPKAHPWFDKVQDAYGRALEFFLRRKWIALLGAILLLALSVWQVVRMGIVMIPDMTSNQIQASLEMPDDKTRAECYETADEILDRMLNVDGIASVGVMSGNDGALFSSAMAGASDNFRSYSFMITTTDANAGATEVKRICDEINDRVADLDVELTISTGMSEMSAMLGSGLSINIYGQDIEKLSEISKDIMEIVDSVEGYTDISNGSEDADQVIHLVMDKNKAMSMGLSVAQIYQALSGEMTLSADAVNVTMDDIDMTIKVVDEMEPLTRENLMDYEFSISVTDEDGDQITEEHKLSEFATEVIEDGISSLSRENQSRYVTVSATVEEGYNTTLLTRELKPLIDNYELPYGYTISLGGEYDSVNEMIKQMALVALLGLAFIYLVMVAQFQSLLSPFIVLFTIPLAFTGGFMALWFTGENMSALSLMGVIVLMGTVVNNGIVFVDYTNQLRIGGLDRISALIATGKTRMRPILMTALTTILAEFNLIFGDDMGSQMGKGMALVIVGGLAYATLMTLFIIPVMYDILFKKEPAQVDIGEESLDDIFDDASEYMMEFNNK